MSPSKTHYYDSGVRCGNSREWGDAPDKVKDSVKENIKTRAAKAGLSEKDTANLLAIADLESGLNPDAANNGSTASGLFQITNKTAKDASKRLNGKPIINGYKYKEPYDRFDPDSNIAVGIAVYLDKKRAAGSDDIEKIYKRYNPRATDAELKQVRILYNKYKKEKHSSIDSNVNAEETSGRSLGFTEPDSLTKLAQLGLDGQDPDYTTTDLRDGANESCDDSLDDTYYYSPFSPGV
jgi:hypothetical protein